MPRVWPWPVGTVVENGASNRGVVVYSFASPPAVEVVWRAVGQVPSMSASYSEPNNLVDVGLCVRGHQHSVTCSLHQEFVADAGPYYGGVFVRTSRGEVGVVVQASSVRLVDFGGIMPPPSLRGLVVVGVCGEIAADHVHSWLCLRAGGFAAQRSDAYVRERRPYVRERRPLRLSPFTGETASGVTRGRPWPWPVGSFVRDGAGQFGVIVSPPATTRVRGTREVYVQWEDTTRRIERQDSVEYVGRCERLHNATVAHSEQCVRAFAATQTGIRIRPMGDSRAHPFEDGGAWVGWPLPAGAVGEFFVHEAGKGAYVVAWEGTIGGKRDVYRVEGMPAHVLRADAEKLLERLRVLSDVPEGARSLERALGVEVRAARRRLRLAAREYERAVELLAQQEQEVMQERLALRRERDEVHAWFERVQKTTSFGRISSSEVEE